MRLDLLNKVRRDRDKTESHGLFSLETETRPRVSPFRDTSQMLYVIDISRGQGPPGEKNRLTQTIKLPI